MLQLINETPFSAGLSVLPNEQGYDTLFVIVKARFSIQAGLKISEEQIPLQEVDDYYGEPGESSIRRPGDYHTGKPSTDIIMLGSACAPDRLPAKRLNVSLAINSVRKDVLVYGNRYWDDGRISAPEAFETMRLRYENAFGGYDEKNNLVETRNPIGTGFRGERTTAQMEGIRLPNLEDPQQQIVQLSDAPNPCNFGAIAPNWEPRVQHAGTYDTDWETNRAPYLPEDYSSRFMNSASRGLAYPNYLEGGENVSIKGMHPYGPIDFLIPKVDLQAIVTIANKTTSLRFVAETLTLEPNRLEFDITWRAQVTYGKRLGHLENVKLMLGSIE